MMNDVKDLIKLFKAGLFMLKYGFYFWVIETIYFLIAYGWHWRAVNSSERNCDTIASLSMFIGLGFLIYVGAKVTEYILIGALAIENEKEET